MGYEFNHVHLKAPDPARLRSGMQPRSTLR